MHNLSVRFTGQNGRVETLPGVDIEMDVIARVAAKSAIGVKGVLALENTFADGIAAAFGKDGRARGVRVISEDGGCVFHISVVTKYGENIPEIAWNLQERVKKQVEELIGAKVKRVNVLIAGIREANGKGGAVAATGGATAVKGGAAATTAGGAVTTTASTTATATATTTATATANVNANATCVVQQV